MKMEEKENLKAYLLRFTNKLNQIERVDSGLAVEIFYDGLEHDHSLKEQLERYQPKDMSEVIYHAEGIYLLERS